MSDESKITKEDILEQMQAGVKMVMPTMPTVSATATIVPGAGIDAAHLLQKLLRIQPAVV